jgi:hypothetical protein
VSVSQSWLLSPQGLSPNKNWKNWNWVICSISHSICQSVIHSINQSFNVSICMFCLWFRCTTFWSWSRKNKTSTTSSSMNWLDRWVTDKFVCFYSPLIQMHFCGIVSCFHFWYQFCFYVLFCFVFVCRYLWLLLWSFSIKKKICLFSVFRQAWSVRREDNSWRKCGVATVCCWVKSPPRSWGKRRYMYVE